MHRRCDDEMTMKLPSNNAKYFSYNYLERTVYKDVKIHEWWSILSVIHAELKRTPRTLQSNSHPPTMCGYEWAKSLTLDYLLCHRNDFALCAFHSIPEQKHPKSKKENWVRKLKCTVFMKTLSVHVHWYLWETKFELYILVMNGSWRCINVVCLIDVIQLSLVTRERWLITSLIVVMISIYSQCDCDCESFNSIFMLFQ